MYKPNWNTAPAWANYLVSWRNMGYWHEKEPKQEQDRLCWTATGRYSVAGYYACNDWRNSLDKRPSV